MLLALRCTLNCVKMKEKRHWTSYNCMHFNMEEIQWPHRIEYIHIFQFYFSFFLFSLCFFFFFQINFIFFINMDESHRCGKGNVWAFSIQFDKMFGIVDMRVLLLLSAYKIMCHFFKKKIYGMHQGLFYGVYIYWISLQLWSKLYQNISTEREKEEFCFIILSFAQQMN